MKTNTLITLPAEVQLKIERDAQNKCERMTENLEEQDSPISHLLKEWEKLYKKEKSSKWFLEHKHNNKVKDIEESCQDIIRIQEDRINELSAQLEMVKKQIK